MNEECPRTLALWRPGVPIDGVGHSYSWSGKIPCTGVLRCTLCGEVQHEGGANPNNCSGHPFHKL